MLIAEDNARKPARSAVGSGLVIGLIVLFVIVPLLRPQATLGAPNYRVYADSGMAALNGWYNAATGLWNTTGWWNSANVLEAVIDYSRRTGSTTYRSVISNTFDRNQAGGFLNDYYDDEGWWALTWIKAYDLTGESRYLTMAKSIFTDMRGGWTATCGGGIWWSKAATYKNAIANELFLSVAIRLHQRTPGDGGAGSYLDWATRSWNWFSASGMINGQNLVNDGLNASTCQNNGQQTWTYNQGVILGGLADLYKATGNAAYLTKAQAIADAAIGRLVDVNGALKEPCEPACGADGPQFKGVFMRNLAYLNETQGKTAYRDFITRNADSIWLKNRNSANQFGLIWSGPFDTANAANQSSALDAINGAIPYGGPNLALNVAASANGSCGSAEVAARAVDGSSATKWCAGPTNNQYWLQVDLGSSKSINQAVIKHAGAGGENPIWNTRDFSILTSVDNLTWSTAVSVGGNTANETNHTFGARSARYVRLLITNPQSDPNFVAARIYEFEVYGPNAAPPSPTPTRTPTPAPPTPTRTPTPTPPPNTRDAYATIEAESFNAQVGTISEATSDVGAGQNIGAIHNGDWLRFDNVNFGSSSPIQVQARVASGAAAGVSGLVEFRLDSQTGPLLGSFALSSTGNWQNWTTVPANISGATGVRTLFVVFKSGQPAAFVNLNWFIFKR